MASIEKIRYCVMCKAINYDSDSPNKKKSSISQILLDHIVGITIATCERGPYDMCAPKNQWICPKCTPSIREPLRQFVRSQLINFVIPPVVASQFLTSNENADIAPPFSLKVRREQVRNLASQLHDGNAGALIGRSLEYLYLHHRSGQLNLLPAGKAFLISIFCEHL